MRSPEPGSAWARHCPDAWPAEYDGVPGLPQGFRRYATDREAALITGRMTEAEFTGRPAAHAPTLAGQAKHERKPNPVVAKVIGFNLFFDGLDKREPRLSPQAVAVWAWLWRCERDGLARCSVRKLAHRLGVNKDTAAAKLNELRDAGFLALVRRGTAGTSATVYRVRPAPRGGPDRPNRPDGTVRSVRT